MLLILKIQTYCHQPVLNGRECRLLGVGGTLGRSADNDLVLDDPAKYISRVHAKVIFRTGNYFLEDVGGNPSVVNDQPLGKGREVMLGHGDRIVVGDYQLGAQFEAVQSVPTSIAPAPFNNPSLPLFEPPPPAKPLALLPLPEGAGVNVALAGPALFHDALASAKILGVMEAFNGGSSTSAQDPLGLNLFDKGFGNDIGSGVPVPMSRPAFIPLIPSFEDDMKPASSGFATFLIPPKVVTQPTNLAIPDDYDLLAGFSLPPAVLPLVQPVPLIAPLAVAQSLPRLQVSAVPVSVFMPAALIPDVTAYSDHVTSALTPTLPSTPQPQEPSVLKNSGVVPGVTKADAESFDSAMLQALLRGLGLPDLKLKDSAPLLAETVGALLREATAGTMDLLMARTLTKKESRVDMTMISTRSNNPLKFFPNAESAMTQLLTGAMAGYLPAVPAMEGAFNDLKAHELAVMAGMRAALAAVLHRFDPARIEQHLAMPTVMDKVLSVNRKARMWDRLVEVYGEIARDADDDLQRLFGEQFSAAYQAQVDRLRPAII